MSASLPTGYPVRGTFAGRTEAVGLARCIVYLMGAREGIGSIQFIV
jgi:hypothetical protein